jgi:transcriptional regulator with XRE-family HTH domain
MGTSHQDIQAIVRVLKQTLRSRGYVYLDVAQHLKVSEVTIKRFFSGSSVSMKHLLAVCDFLHVQLLEAAAIARDFEHPEYVLNDAQDRYFAGHPKYYAIFIDLYRRKSVSEVKKYWSLDNRIFFKILRSFEKLQLLEVLPKNGYRFKMSGPVKVPARGLFRRIFFEQNLSFLEYVQREIENPRHILQTSEVLLSKKNAAEFQKEFQELSRKYRSQAFIDETVLPAHLKESVRWLFAYAPYETDWRE